MTSPPSGGEAGSDQFRDPDASERAPDDGLDAGVRPARPPERVRVTAPRAGSPAASARHMPHHAAEAPTSDIAGVYVRSLIRSQLRLGIVFAVGFAVATALFVLAIAVVPQLDTTFVAGVPLSWLLLGAGVYPLAITVGGLYVRAATRNEARYRSLTEDG